MSKGSGHIIKCFRNIFFFQGYGYHRLNECMFVGKVESIFFAVGWSYFIPSLIMVGKRIIQTFILKVD